ncbi:hypothetical protein MUK42_33662 [Musa troglodytarum]|uniref:Uncharacterized protein n=1 Tax=Musa troglodytarum TaxID=320322 RepID=A0A9E7JUG3_9LILI|nr:hypothetical protein MUK42_33662 [Musa troglodytarum]
MQTDILQLLEHIANFYVTKDRSPNGWIGFFWIIWLAVKKSLDLTKRSVRMTSSAISAYSTARQTNQNRWVESKE